MTVPTSSTTARNSYTANGTTTVFNFTFEVLEETDAHSLQVILVDSDGNETIQEEDTDYTVTLNDDRKGSITFNDAPANNNRVILLSNINRTQATDYNNLGTDKFPADSHEAALDKLTLIAREIDEKVGRAVSLPPSSNASDVTLPLTSENANRVVVINEDGDGFEPKTLIDLEAVAVSPFAENLLDDNSAEGMRDTLELGDIATTDLIDEDDFASDSDEQAPTQQSVKRYVDDTVNTVSQFFDYITVTQGTTDTEHGVILKAGTMVFDDNSGTAELENDLEKNIHQSWVVGAGGGLQGSLSPNKRYSLYAIYNPTDDIVDGVYIPDGDDFSYPNSSYTKKEYKGSVFTNASENIVAFRQAGNKFFFKNGHYPLYNETWSTTTATIDTQLPNVTLLLKHFLNVSSSGSYNGLSRVFPADESDVTITVENATARAERGDFFASQNLGFPQVVTDNSGEIKIRVSRNDSSARNRLYLVGWEDTNLRNY